MAPTKKYELTPEHRAQLEPWRDRWIANAFATGLMSGEERAQILLAVRGLYRAAGLTPPPDDRIVIVPSPTVARFTGGFAAAIWWRRKNPHVRLRDATEDATRDATEDATWAATRDATEDATWAATWAATWDATRDATWAATRDATWAATEDATRDATWAATEDATRDATWAATRDATRAATRAATEAATRDATEDATWAATWAATRDATWAATRDATWAATEDATRDATWAATEAATWAATRDATWAATEDARNHADSDESSWFRIPSRMFAQLAHMILSDDAMLGLQCAVNAYQMWNGGNQWSGWVAFLSFFRHVAKLAIDYTKWDSYETLARVGPRVMHAEFCLVSERPIKLTVDEQNRAHCADGPYCEWADGTAIYAWHGVHAPAWIIEHPERITVQHIQQEQNAEIRRVLLERFGFDRYIRESGAVPVHADAFGTLYRCELPGEEEPLVVVSVMNSTPELDGHVKQYVLRVEPELKPLPPGDWSSERKRAWLDEQRPQALTARNAIASLHGLRGEQYQPAMET